MPKLKPKIRRWGQIGPSWKEGSIGKSVRVCHETVVGTVRDLKKVKIPVPKHKKKEKGPIAVTGRRRETIFVGKSYDRRITTEGLPTEKERRSGKDRRTTK